ncbi:kinetochore-associated Ndc80 complex subunit ndc80, partial [Cladochytrium tenue]
AYLGRPSNVGVAAAALGSSGPSAILKDPRNIRDKAWQAGAVRQLIGFLVQAGFNQPVSPKTLQAPSAKDFQAIFRFLYAQLDPGYVFVKKFEEEVPVILKGLRYPFSDQISKSHLQSVGSMHAWPTLLAMLNWMVELILCCDQIDTCNDLGMDAPQNNERAFYGYLTKAYASFLAGEDNYDQMDNELVAEFERKNAKVAKEIEQLEAENAILEKERAALADSESPLTVARRENATLKSDIDKFKQYIQHLEQKQKKLDDQSTTIQEELEAAERELESTRAEKDQLQKTVDLQEISQADVDRMVAEREQLVKTRQALADKTDAQNNELWKKEIDLQKMLDQ